MSEALREFCPACKKEVEYEIDLELGGQKFCPICGRTKEMAEKGFKAEQLIKKRKDREKSSSALWRGVIIFVFVIIAALFVLGLLIYPDRVFGAAKEGFLGIIGVTIIALIIGGLVYAAYKLVMWARGR